MAELGRRGHRYCDIVVVGSGHAATEAALAASRLGLACAMVTLNPGSIAAMPCNPAVGGPGKAQIVSEIDALGGEMALATDEAAIQFRVLNASKGPAVQSLRAQVDKRTYSAHMRRALDRAGVQIVGGMVQEILLRGTSVSGVRLAGGEEIRCERVVLCTGVYLESRIIIGEIVRESGPLGEPGAYGLSANLLKLGFRLGRFKTGTSPRIARDSIDWDQLNQEESADRPLAFSFVSQPRIFEDNVCYFTYTTPETHEIIRRNIHRAPLFNGTIEGVGPRYCPSIEDKVMRFPDRERHQIHLEFESRESPEVYILGLSTSLPADVQEEMVHSLPGLRRAVITRPGYAIEYDYLIPSQLKPTLELQEIEGLYAAGQVNGTSGYEEAAAQGLIAGINASCSMLGREQVVLGRDQAYIGVLIDDLVSKVVEEPYRMLTSRVEYRLMLRQSNADLRLTPLGRKIGLVTDERWEAFQSRLGLLERGRELLDVRVGGIPVRDQLRSPERRIRDFLGTVPGLRELPDSILDELEVEAKYAGFIERQQREAQRLERYRAKRIPVNMDFRAVPGLSNEARDRLKRYAPATIGRALEVGVSPADVLVLLSFLKDRDSSGR